MYFKDRRDAGRRLGEALVKYKDQGVVVLGLPRGGVVVAEEVASILRAPLGLLLARKIGHPMQPEYAIAAVSESGHLVGSNREIESIDHAWFKAEKEHQIQEIKRRQQLYFKGRTPPSVAGKMVILVDDGIATGLTMQVGILELKDRKPKKIVVAVPVSPLSTAELIGSMVDDFVGLEVPPDGEFEGAVGSYYASFTQVEDREVVEILDRFTEKNV